MRFYTIICLNLLVVSSSLAQQTSFSPYSRFGLGDLHGPFINKQLGMAGASTGLVDLLNTNITNPASYAFIAQPSLEAGIQSNWYTIRDSEEQVTGNVTSINHLVFGLPLKSSDMGVSFGLVPFSRVGYDLTEIRTIGNSEDEYELQNEGSGGLNNLFFGIGRRIALDEDTLYKENTYLSFGANFKYQFGSLTNIRRSIFPGGTGYINTQSLSNFNVSDVAFDFGFLFSSYIKKRSGMDDPSSIKLNIGANFNPASLLTVDRATFVESFFGDGVNNTYRDSILADEEIEGKVNLPAELSFGSSVTFLGKNFQQLTLAVDYRSRQWSNYYVDFGAIESTDELINNQRVSFGFEYTPNLRLNYLYADIQPKDYFKAIYYRAGVFTNKGYLNIEGEEFNEIGINFGVGLPLIRGRKKVTSSELSLGVQYSKRGSLNNGLIEEDQIKLYVAIRLNPDLRLNPWFVKRKYD